MNTNKVMANVLAILLFAVASVARADVVVVSGLQDQVGSGIGPGGSISLNFGVSQLTISDVNPDGCVGGGPGQCNSTLRFDGVYTPINPIFPSFAIQTSPGYLLDPSVVNTNPSLVAYSPYLDAYRVAGNIPLTGDYALNVGSNLLIPFIYNGGTQWDAAWLNVTITEPVTGVYDFALNGYGYDDSGAAVAVGIDPVPEPSEYALLLSGLLLLGFVLRRNKENTPALAA